MTRCHAMPLVPSHNHHLATQHAPAHTDNTAQFCSTSTHARTHARMLTCTHMYTWAWQRLVSSHCVPLTRNREAYIIMHYVTVKACHWVNRTSVHACCWQSFQFSPPRALA